MKTLTVVAAMMIAATMQARDMNGERATLAEGARYGNVRAEKAAQAYLACLKSENDGVRESALAQVAMLALARPDGDYGTLKTEVKEIARRAKAPELRYKAFLASSALESPEIFTGIARPAYATGDHLFAAIAGRLAEYHAAR